MKEKSKVLLKEINQVLTQTMPFCKNLNKKCKKKMQKMKGKKYKIVVTN